MFVARPFALNTVPAALASTARASITKTTTTIKG
ncbi:hypothetical protein ABIC63_000315 [Pseudacidovorax sp. 1753]|uniref:Uncharacterized protein n=1 Tax=Pseudacidovorax intermedius TaxID=433924 RepID=A0A370FM15_9BURK|nr:hypothetical protein DFR41_10382 [Pseudacidovorax intermedius]SIQ85350.1 hypothetical protein SAMN05880557_10684 [Pseudacidovorax sp. RU35E]